MRSRDWDFVAGSREAEAAAFASLARFFSSRAFFAIPSDWALRAQRLIYYIQQGIPTYGNTAD